MRFVQVLIDSLVIGVVGFAAVLLRLLIGIAGGLLTFAWVSCLVCSGLLFCLVGITHLAGHHAGVAGAYHLALWLLAFSFGGFVIQTVLVAFGTTCAQACAQRLQRPRQVIHG